MLLRAPLCSKLVSIFLFCLTIALAEKLQLSTDNGVTWHDFDTPLSSHPQRANIRVDSQSSTVLRLPSCALEGSLIVQVWRRKQSEKPLGLRWQSNVCQPHLALANTIAVEDLIVHRHKPDWLDFAYQKKKDRSQIQPEKEEGKGFFGKYGLYIMIFVGIALAQGIRKGLVELHEEMEREERAQQEKRVPRNTKVVVPRRQESAKTRKRNPSGAKR